MTMKVNNLLVLTNITFFFFFHPDWLNGMLSLYFSNSV